ncbi:3',5'-cyclic-AMP phosphodiesterase [Zhongshania sp.]|uniref:3',5'-cyclic-AMP phosphodiesterase n=1 Tax=Zhongshania sp. TaxID=1971902 RepID=UPI0035619F3D
MKLPVQSNKAPLCVVQISDCHLGADSGDCLLGMDTDHSLEAVLQSVAADCPEIDILVASGDLAAHGDASAYQRLAARLKGMAKQVVWLPGNHDSSSLMQSVVGDQWMPSRLMLDGWQLVFLNSAVPDQVGGFLANDQLAILAEAGQFDCPTLVFVHHHLRPVACAWLDEQQIANADAVFATIANKDQFKAIICGHVHQQSEQVFQNIGLLTTPSTCVQFAPNSDDFALDDRNPGYRRFWLGDKGEFQTRVSRVKGVIFAVDNLARGYE